MWSSNFSVIIKITFIDKWPFLDLWIKIVKVTCIIFNLLKKKYDFLDQYFN